MTLLSPTGAQKVFFFIQFLSKKVTTQTVLFNTNCTQAAVGGVNQEIPHEAALFPFFVHKTLKEKC